MRFEPQPPALQAVRAAIDCHQEPQTTTRECSCLDAGGRAALLFAEGESRVERAMLHRNGNRPLRGDIATGVDFEDRYPWLCNTLWEANPDPRPESRSAALPKTLPAEGTAEGTPPDVGQYIGAFGEDENWLEEWTFFGPESDYDTRVGDDGGN